ncbi:MAG: flagellar basal body L-ring protein FlgH [Myxococcota bacterium]
MKAPLWILALCIAAPAAAKKNKAPPQAPPTPPPLVQPTFDAPPPGSWVSISVSRRMAGMDGYSRLPGDIVTVRLVEQTSTSLDALTATENNSSQNAKISTLFGMESPVPIGGGSGDLGIGTSRDSSFSGKGKTGRGSRIDSVVSCTITEILRPVNDYKIWCSKQVTINKETQWVILTGQVRARDIARDNTIPSNLVAHAEIEVTGRGVVGDKQRPGILARVLDKLWPF